MTQFTFLQREWPSVFEAAGKAASPFTDLTPRGPDGLFSTTQLDALLTALAAVRATAVAA